MIRGGGGVSLRSTYNKTRKMVPIPRRASSFLVVVFVCMYVNSKLEEDGIPEQQLQNYKFTQG